MQQSHFSREELIKQALSRYIIALIGLAAMFFLPAWTLRYWEAWAYIILLFGSMAVVMVYLLKNDPGLLERRMKMREQVAGQNLLIRLSYVPFFLAYLIPGFDVRFGWSNVPLGVIIAGFIVVWIGYFIIFLTFRENSFASRVVEVSQEQKVISTGPYAFVRHPMYIGCILLYVISPLALGSYWALIPAAVVIPVIVARIVGEEKLLKRELKGYEEYTQKVRYRLVPGIW